MVPKDAADPKSILHEPRHFIPWESRYHGRLKSCLTFRINRIEIHEYSSGRLYTTQKTISPTLYGGVLGEASRAQTQHHSTPLWMEKILHHPRPHNAVVPTVSSLNPKP